ncbi:MAG TPA: hypothetical protein VF711_00920, partial [Acidimicrobiales bacterium]
MPRTEPTVAQRITISPIRIRLGPVAGALIVGIFLVLTWGALRDAAFAESAIATGTDPGYVGQDFSTSLPSSGHGATPASVTEPIHGVSP